MITSRLQIYKDTFELVDKIIKWKSEGFPKKFRYDVGEKLVATALELFEYIQLANTFPERRELHMTGFLVKFELLCTILHLCFKNRLFPLKLQADLARLTTSVGKQATAWKKSRSHGNPG